MGAHNNRLQEFIDGLRGTKPMDMDEAAEVLDHVHAALSRKYGDLEEFEEVDAYLKMARASIDRFEEPDVFPDEDHDYELWRARRDV